MARRQLFLLETSRVGVFAAGDVRSDSIKRVASSIADIKLTTDSDGNVYIHNSGIESILPSQLSGTALYDTSDPQTPIDELVSSPYSLNLQQLLQSSSSGSQFFKKKPCGCYEGDDDLLDWKNDHYELKDAEGRLIVFRPDGRLNY